MPKENTLPEVAETADAVIVPTAHGTFAMRPWGFADGTAHMTVTALDSTGAPRPAGEDGVPLVRVHSECATGDIFGSYRCDCGPQLAQGLAQIDRDGGVMLYVRNHEGRGIGLVNKLRAYALQDQGVDTLDANLQLGLPADGRDYSQAAAILHELGHTHIRLMSNNPAKAEALASHGIEVLGLVPDEVPARPENARYLATKRDRMRHVLTQDFS